MERRMEFTVSIAPQPKGGYTVQCVELPGAVSEGETLDEALENIRDAIKMIIGQRRQEFRQASTRTPAARFQSVEVDA